MKFPKASNGFELIAKLIDEGKIIPMSDGTFRLDAELHQFLQELINKKPELYAKLFPDRVN